MPNNSNIKGSCINNVWFFGVIFDPPCPPWSDFYLLQSDFFGVILDPPPPQKSDIIYVRSLIGVSEVHKTLGTSEFKHSNLLVGWFDLFHTVFEFKQDLLTLICQFFAKIE